MMEEYLEYWGFDRHPFLLAPDSAMMCLTGQYYEGFERLKYAIATGKGGALLVSEDAGLGKTTLLLRLIDEMKQEYGDAFRHAYVDHPTLSSSQMIARIAGEISGTAVGEDKLANLALLKDALIEAKRQGGRSIIIVDEGQLLCEAHDVLQELRILINLTHESEYLHTFVLSGQRALWNTVKGMPEFWQRLPVRYYLVPLKVEETKELIRYRVRRAGVEGREVFQDDALEIIHRYSRGSPRTLIALSDLSLLVGFTNRATSIGFKEVSKAIQAMSGQGESLPYVREEKTTERGPSLDSISSVERPIDRPVERPPWRKQEYPEATLRTAPPQPEKFRKIVRPGPIYVILAIAALVFGGGAAYLHISNVLIHKKITASETAMLEAAAKRRAEAVAKPAADPDEKPLEEPRAVVPPREEAEARPSSGPFRERIAVVVAEAGNIRSAPDLDAPRIGVIFRNEAVRVKDEKLDKNGGKWLKVLLYGQKEGWISDRVMEIREAGKASP